MCLKYLLIIYIELSKDIKTKYDFSRINHPLLKSGWFYIHEILKDSLIFQVVDKMNLRHHNRFVSRIQLEQ